MGAWGRGAPLLHAKPVGENASCLRQEVMPCLVGMTNTRNLGNACPQPGSEPSSSWTSAASVPVVLCAPIQWLVLYMSLGEGHIHKSYLVTCKKVYARRTAKVKMFKNLGNVRIQTEQMSVCP